MNNYIITVKQSDVSTPRLYKMESNNEPTIEELKELGINYHAPREDTITIDQVSDALYTAMPARWIRP